MAAIAALIVLTCAAYSNSFSTGFPFDNRQLILQDARVHEASGANVDLILGHSYWWPYGESGLYRPVTTLSYLFNYAVLGNADRPAGYHWFNLALHAINVLLVYVLMLRLTGPAEAGHYGRSAAPPVVSGSGRTSLAPPVVSGSSRTSLAPPVVSGFSRTSLAPPVVSGFSRTSLAFVTAAIWAVHPLCTEAVTNIVGRADLLAALAVLTAFVMHLRGRVAAGTTRLAWFAGVAAISTLGLFSKESAVVIVPVIATYELVWWDPRRSRRALTWAAAALVPPLLLMWSQRAAVLGSSPAAEFTFVDNPIVGAGFWTGRLTAIEVMARYLRLVAWPATLSNDYSYSQIPLFRGTPGDWIACLAVAALAVAAIAAFWWRRELFFPAAFAFVTLLPASNLPFPTGTIMAERLMYLPSVGLIALVVVALFAAARAVGARVPFLIAIAIAIGALSYRTWTRNPVWHDDVTLWTSAVRAVPASAKAHRALAEALYDADPAHANLDRVIAEAEQSVALLSAVPDRWNSYQTYRQAGAYYLDARQYQKALPLLQRCLAIVRAASAQTTGASAAPEADATRLLAAAYLGLNDTRQALDAAIRARALGPLNPLAYRLAADALLGQRRPDDAAVTLMVGSIVTDDPGLGQAVAGLYRSGFDEQGCAVVSTPQGPALNPSCPIVREHMCRAAAEAVEIDVRLGRAERAERARSVAAGAFGCR